MKFKDVNYSELYWDGKKHKFRKKPGKFIIFLKTFIPNWWYDLSNWWNHFWYDSHWDDIFGYGSHTYKTFNISKLALIIAIITFLIVIVISYITLYGK